jgi:CheY-like chemotaxis protein/MinD-like ATPase involved in chromosome partitioning or flagellar assembly
MAEKVLIIDDDIDTVNYISVLIKRMGYQPLGASGGIQALKIAHEHKPDLIILDVMMPGMDGYEVARSLRRHPDTALIPILMFTAKTQVRDKVTGYESGVDIYLTKPAHPVDLQANIKTLLARSKSRAEKLNEAGYTVGVVAAKGGLGVSTVALNLAIAYKNKQRGKVIAAEMKPGQGSWAVELGLTSPNGLADLLKSNLTEITPGIVEQQLVSTTFGVPLLLSSSELCGSECAIALAQYEAVIDILRQMTRLIVLDIGTDFHPAFELFTNICNEMIVITEPQPLSVKRTRFLISELKKKDYGSAKALTAVMVNRVHTGMAFSMSQVEEAIGQSVALGFPPVPELAYQSAMRSSPIYEMQSGSIITQQFDNLAGQIAQHMSR